MYEYITRESSRVRLVPIRSLLYHYYEAVIQKAPDAPNYHLKLSELQPLRDRSRDSEPKPSQEIPLTSPNSSFDTEAEIQNPNLLKKSP